MVKPSKAATRIRDKKTTKGGSRKGVLSNRHTRSQAKKGKPMITANVKNGHARPESLVNDWSTAPDRKPKDEVAQLSPGVTESLAGIRARALKGKAPAVTPLANVIRNAYKSAKAGEQEKAILARIEAVEPVPTPQEIAHALVASGIPAHRAGKVAMRRDSIHGSRGQQTIGLIRQALKDQEQPPAAQAGTSTVFAAGKWTWEDLGRMITHWEGEKLASYLGFLFRTAEKGQRYAILLGILRGISPAPERLDALISEVPERDRMVLAQQYRDGIAIQAQPAIKPLKADVELSDPWRPGESPSDAWRKKADAAKWDEEQREDEYNAEIAWPRRNRLRRAYQWASAEFHGLHDAVAQVLAMEIVDLRIVDPGPYPLNWLNDVLVSAEIPTSLNLSIGFQLAKMGLGSSREWKIQTLKKIVSWAPKGLEPHYRASVLFSFRPMPNLSEADSLLDEAGYSEVERARILKAFEGIAARGSEK